MKDLGIGHQLHPIQDGQNFLLPPACFALSSEEKLKVCNFLADLKVPDAFSSNISRNDDGPATNCTISIFKNTGQAKGRLEPLNMSHIELHEARMYVLQNSEEVAPFLKQYEENRASTSNEIDYSDFPDWFRARVQRNATDELISLAIGPNKIANLYPMFMVNGFRFHTRARNRKVYLFKCTWWDVARLRRGYKIDKYGFVSVNTHCSLNTNEPFVWASQAEQVFYVKEIMDEDWLFIVKTSPCDLFNMPNGDELIGDEQVEASQQLQIESNVQSNDEIDVNEEVFEMNLHRDDIEPENISLINNNLQRGVQDDSNDAEDNDIDVNEDEDYI
ncbi:uncharacterized protein G2W53_007869 [Senna tora]|uniref:DUF4216 domain-containing protein n=1 Tax=Senna tora TaxID=362788 RepID=A0A835CHN0_9FABA|nr:uncharacterized protein G2W53_007869 [Senna tora]